MMKRTFTAFHGTLASRIDSIRETGIYASDNSDDWLGEGIYYFIDGLDDPWTSAVQWARCKAWDKADHEFDEHDVAVIEAQIVADEDAVFDLRERGNALQFHQRRRRWLQERIPRRGTRQPRPGEKVYDTDLLDEFKVAQGIDVLISDFHIQLSIRERHFRIDSRIPNVSVLCVTNPAPRTEVTVTNIRVVPHASRIETETESL